MPSRPQRATRTTSPSTAPRASTCTSVRAVYLSGTLEPNCWIDISDTLERKIDALFCHASQLPDEAGEWFRDFLRERAEDAGAAAGVKFAEPFRTLIFQR